MAKSSILEPTRSKKQTVLINVFAGTDRSTARFRIEGKGERLYETKNVFPYIQGELLRRRDAVQTNSRDSDNAFPAFPALSLSGNAVVKKVIEFNNTICILYEDSGDTGKLLLDSIDIGSNTITNRISKTSNGGGAYTFASNGKIDAVPYSTTGSGRTLFIDGEGRTQFIKVNTSWVISITGGSQTSGGICEVFLQTFVSLHQSENNKIGRTAVGLEVPYAVTYILSDAAGAISGLTSFGYQTSSAGATTVLLIFKPSSMWVLTGVGTTESIEQITGNIGLVGKNAITYTPFGVCFVGRDTDGLLNLYILDRNSLVLHTIGHELYEELNNVPPENYGDIVMSFHRNRMVRIALTKPIQPTYVSNNQEYWIDFYNGIKKRTLWGPNTLPIHHSLTHAISFSGGNDPADSGFFMLLKESDTYKIYEEADTDTYNSTHPEWDNQIWRTKIYDFGRYYGIVYRIIIVAKANGAKFKVYYEEPKLTGDDDDTTETLIGSYQMGTTGNHVSKPIRIISPILKKQVGIKIKSDYSGADNNPLEISQIGFEYEVTQREVIE